MMPAPTSVLPKMIFATKLHKRKQTTDVLITNATAIKFQPDVKKKKAITVI